MSAAWKQWPLPEAGTDLWDWQDGRCAMCGTDKRTLVSDHCHDTGFVRGLLCKGCNTREGVSTVGSQWDGWRVGDTPARAIRHLERHVSSQRHTEISRSSALTFYTYHERLAWWAEVAADVSEGGEWPVTAPWTEIATARRDEQQAELRAAMDRIGRRLFPNGFGKPAA